MSDLELKLNEAFDKLDQDLECFVDKLTDLLSNDLLNDGTMLSLNFEELGELLEDIIIVRQVVNDITHIIENKDSVVNSMTRLKRKLNEFIKKDELTGGEDA